MENADLAAFLKDFLLLNNKEQTMRTKRMCPKILDQLVWCEASPYRSRSTDQVALETYLPDIKVKRYRTYRADSHITIGLELNTIICCRNNSIRYRTIIYYLFNFIKCCL